MRAPVMRLIASTRGIRAATVRERTGTTRSDRFLTGAARKEKGVGSLLPERPEATASLRARLGKKKGLIPFSRTGFSLAEIMVAIAILGIGLLMAAAAFPTGLDQTRIITELSTAPLVAKEAVNLISRELSEVKETNPILWQCWQERWVWFQPIGENVQGCGTLQFKNLFPSKYDTLKIKAGFTEEVAELHTRAYPFGTPYTSARYSWTPLMKFLTDTDVVQILILVNSGGEAANPTEYRAPVKELSDGFQRLEIDLNDIGLITEGTVLVRRFTGEQVKVAARDDDPPPPASPSTKAYFFLDQTVKGPAGQTTGFTLPVWILPVDADTGRAKVIGTYQYYLSL